MPFPLPVSEMIAASLPAVAPLIFDPARPPTSTTITYDQKKKIKASEDFLKAFVQQQHADFVPLPLVSPPSPVKAKHSGSASPSPGPSPSSNVFVEVSGRASASGSLTPLRLSQNTGLFSPVSLAATSSPDPMALIAPAYRPKVGAGHKKTLSTDHIVVEVPRSSKTRSSTEESEVKPPTAKRPARIDSQGRPIRPAGDIGRSVFSEITSEADFADDVNMESDDEGRYVSAKLSSPAKRQAIPSSVTPRKKVKQSSGVSGEKEVEVQLEKLQDLLQKIFEIEDAIKMASNSPRKRSSQSNWDLYFITYNERDMDKPLLQATCMGKIGKALSGLLRVPGGRKAIEQKIEPEEVSRLLRILERSISQAEDLQVVPDGVSFSIPDFATASAAASPRKPANGKKSKKAAATAATEQRRRSTRSATPASYDEQEYDGERGPSDADEDEEDEFSQSTPSSSRKVKTSGKRKKSESQSQGRSAKSGEVDKPTWTDSDLDTLEENLLILRNAVQAIDLAMAILTAGKLEMQIYSEDLITSCLLTVKTQLSSVVYPVLDPDNSQLGAVLGEGNVSALLRAVMQITASLLPRLTALVKQEEMSENVIINAVYVAVTPFFVEQGGKSTKSKYETLGVSEMKVIRAHALGLVQTVGSRVSTRSRNDRDRSYNRFLRDTPISGCGLSRRYSAQ